MRLIDANGFIANLKNYMDKPMTAGLCATLIELTPTAYDIDKVVEELEEMKTINVDVGFGTIYKTIRKDVAIEIVKAGGKNDN